MTTIELYPCAGLVAWRILTDWGIIQGGVHDDKVMLKARIAALWRGLLFDWSRGEAREFPESAPGSGAVRFLLNDLTN